MGNPQASKCSPEDKDRFRHDEDHRRIAEELEAGGG